MKTAAVTLLFGVCVLLLSALTVSAVSLHAKPDSKQFFSNCGQVSLRCVDDKQTADGWTVKRTTGGVTEDCGLAAGFDLDDSQCNLNLCSPSEGAYFCEASSGQRSDEVNITVSEKGVILEIPALPVITGSDVTLRCRQSNGDTVAAYFFFSGRLLGSRCKEHTISNVQQSNEGLYWCATDLAGPSPKSFLKIRDPITAFRSSVAPPHLETMRSSSSLPSSSHPTSSSSPPPQPPPSSMSVFRLLFHLLVFCPYFITTGLLLSIYLDRISATRSGNRVVLSMEMTHQGGQNEDVAVDVTTEHDFSE